MNELAKLTIQLFPVEGNKDVKSRMGKFAAWLEDNQIEWWNPDLAAYRDYLLQSLSANSVKSHLGTIRSRYTQLLMSNALRDALYSMIPEHVTGEANRAAVVNEYFVRLQNAIHPTSAPVQAIVKQDRSDQEHYRFTPDELMQFLSQCDLHTLRGRRDAAMFALLICTGLRKSELVALDVEDLSATSMGNLCVLVREGKNSKQRLVPYGKLDWCLVYVRRWLQDAGITEGAIFRGITKDNDVLSTRMTARNVQNIVQKYPISYRGEVVRAKPHDLRRSYARNLFESGMELIAIQQSLGHKDLTTTRLYIGDLNILKRLPEEVYTPPDLLIDVEG